MCSSRFQCITFLNCFLEIIVINSIDGTLFACSVPSRFRLNLTYLLYTTVTNSFLTQLHGISINFISLSECGGREGGGFVYHSHWERGTLSSGLFVRF